MSETIREPQQQRSIDKKNRIIQAGYQLFAKKGYFNTNTAEIAKKAEVSTGIVYGYFHDKKDILIEVLEIYIENVFEPVFETFNKIAVPLNFDTLIPQIIDQAVETHKNNAEIHEALHSLTYTDSLINEKFMTLEKAITDKFVKILKANGYENENVYERVHLAMEMVQSYAHECVYDNHNYLEYRKMRSLIIEMLKNLFTKLN